MSSLEHLARFYYLTLFFSPSVYSQPLSLSEDEFKGGSLEPEMTSQLRKYAPNKDLYAHAPLVKITGREELSLPQPSQSHYSGVKVKESRGHDRLTPNLSRCCVENPNPLKNRIKRVFSLVRFCGLIYGENKVHFF